LWDSTLDIGWGVDYDWLSEFELVRKFGNKLLGNMGPKV
jgi:hypothetical protein